MPQYSWDASARRFRDAAGKLVSPDDVRSAVRDVAQAAADRLSALTGDLADGRVNLAEWNLQARALLKSAHTAATAAASGGWRQVDSWDYAGRRLRAAYTSLDGWEAAFRAGEISAAQLAAGVATLGRSAAGTFEGQGRRLAEKAGAEQERRVLGAARHCSECLELAALGWRPAGELPAVGDCLCRGNCACHMEYRGGPPEPEVPEVVPPREPATQAKADATAATARRSAAKAKATAKPEADVFAEMKAKAAARRAAAAEAASAKAEAKGTFPADLAARLASATRPSDARQAAIDWVEAHATTAGRPVQAHGMPAPEPMREVRVAGLTVRFPAIGDRTNSAVADTIRSLASFDVPPELARHTKEIVLATARNAQDAEWERRYDIPGFVSQATGGDGKVVVYNGSSAGGGNLAHEMGHNLATGRYGDTHPLARSDYGAAIRSGERPVSEYAAKSPGEDFAEAVRLYAEDRDKLRAEAPNRFRVIDRLMQDPTYGG